MELKTNTAEGPLPVTFISSTPLVDIPFYVFSMITINTLLLFISTGYGPTSLLVKIINLSFNTLLN